MFGLGFWELAVILIVALLVLGPTKLPAIARSLGKGLREIRRASSDLRASIQEPLEEIRKPLQDIRDDLVDTVYNIRNEIEAEAKEPSSEETSVDDQSFAALKENEQRQNEVEKLYAQANEESRPDVADITSDETAARDEREDAIEDRAVTGKGSQHE